MTDDDGLRDLLIEIRTKLDMALERLADHEARLRALERTKLMFLGAAATSGGILGAVASKITGS